LFSEAGIYDAVMRSSVPADIRYSLRQIRRAPLFTLTVVLTLGIGIGLTTAIFSLIYAVMLRSLPVADPGSLYRIGTGPTCCYSHDLQGQWGIFSYDFYQRLRRSTPQFEQVAAFQARPGVLSVRYGKHQEQAQALLGEYVSGNYFETLGVQPFAGRLFTFADDQRNSAPVAVMSYRTWQQDFGGDPSVINANFTFEGFAFKVVGITPPGFYGDTINSVPTALWIPLQTEYLTDADASFNRDHSSAWLRVIGRLRPGAQLAGASSELTAMLQHWLVSDADMDPIHRREVEQDVPNQKIEIASAASGVGGLRDRYGSNLMILLAVCATVLLIGCANVANLLLARGMTRRLEVSIMSALGAPGARLMQRALTDSLVLAFLGGIAGVFLALLGTRLVVLLVFGHATGMMMHVGLSWPMLAFSAVTALLSGVCFGTVPAWLLARADPIEAMRGAGRSSGGSQPYLRKMLVVLQVATSVSLLAGASLLTRSLINLERQDFGFTAQNRITVRIEEPLAAYSHEHLNVLYRDLQVGLERLPGVRSASLALYSPFISHWEQLIVKPGEGMPPIDGSRKALWDRVSSEYFRTVGQQLLEGREFTEADNAASRQVAVVNQSFARRFFPGVDPLGQAFGFATPGHSKDFVIVGVVQDARYSSPEQAPEPMVFGSLAQQSEYTEATARDTEKWSYFITGAQLWIDGNLGALEPQIREVFRGVDPNFAIVGIQSLQQQIDVNFDERRMLVRLSGLLGVVALMLASIGLFGVTAYNVTRRTGEIGVRMALGAGRTQIALLILRTALTQTLVGLAIGLPVAFMVGRFLKSRLYEVSAIDPLSLLLPAAALLLCASAAGLLPAIRAASIEPVEALRVE
jgi:predicted permease